MIRNRTLAVVVSYNGLDQLSKTVHALLKRVCHVHIVDNGSGIESLNILSTIEQESGVSVVRLGSNRGIGYALNQGVALARKMGCDWLLTMDQDSVIDPGMLRAYDAVIAERADCVCLTPRRDERASQTAPRRVTYAITSGNLVRVGLFDEIGLYDHDIVLVPGAVMQHQLGEAIALPAWVRPFYARHSPARRYYMYRNYLYLAERHLWRFPIFIVKLGILQVLLLPFIAVFDREPLRSYRAVIRGIVDYFARRSGPCREGA
jgi:rhamnosyltransferase